MIVKIYYFFRQKYHSTERISADIFPDTDAERSGQVSLPQTHQAGLQV